MNVLLLNSPYIDSIYDFKQEFSVEYPLGLAYLAGMMEQEKIPNDVLDANALGLSLDSAIQRILNKKPDILGLTATTTTIIICSKIAGKIKEKLPNTITIVGGAHLSAFPDACIEEFPSFDYAVQGDGELPLVELYHTLIEGKTVSNDSKRWVPTEKKGGIWFRDHCGKIAHYETIRQFKHLDDIPFANRQKFPNDKYRVGPLMDIGYRGSQIGKIAGSRGCPYRCVFCSEGKSWPPYRSRTPENIFKEMETMYHKEGVRHIFFVDDTINVRTNDLMKLSEMIIKSGMKIYWHCYARVHPIDDEILSAMKRSGCFGIMFGVESGDPHLIKTLGKNINLEQARNAIRLSKKFDLKTLAFFMFGLPGDTPETCENTIRFAKELNPDLAFFSMTVPFPGTELYDNYVQSKVLPTNFTWDAFTLHKKNSMHQTANMSSEEVLYYYNKAHTVFYLRPRYWARVIKRMIQHPQEIKNYWWMMKEFILTHKWIPSPVNPGSRSRA